MVSRFAGRVALLTGAASGIGAATARRLASEGASVMITDVADERGAGLAARLVADGATAWYRHLDVTEPDQWAATVDDVHDRAGRLDVLGLNTGRNIYAPLQEITNEQWHGQIDLALTSVLYGVRATLVHLIDARGSVVVTSSIHAVAGFKGFPAYAAAKGGVSALTRQLAVEYGPAVRFNAVQPGAIETDLWAGLADSARDRVVRSTPARRMGTPDNVAAAIAFLASDDAAYVTGVNLLVDGGRFIAEQD